MSELKGLFGGTFDPIHCGHLRAATEVRTRFRMDKVLFIPSFIPPHKESRGVTSAPHRLKMVELACRGEPGFEVSSIEVDAGETSYSIITMEKIKKLNPGTKIFFILGLDAFLEVETWREHERLLEECLFIVMTRPGYHFSAADRVLGRKAKNWVHQISESEEIDGRLFESYKIFFLSIRALDISSTEIRRRIRAGESVKGLVPDAVEDYIHSRHLYQKQGA